MESKSLWKIGSNGFSFRNLDVARWGVTHRGITVFTPGSAETAPLAFGTRFVLHQETFLSGGSPITHRCANSGLRHGNKGAAETKGSFNVEFVTYHHFFLHPLCLMMNSICKDLAVTNLGTSLVMQPTARISPAAI